MYKSTKKDYSNKKRTCTSSDNDDEESQSPIKKFKKSKPSTLPDPAEQAADLNSLITINDTLQALTYLRSKFDPCGQFNNSIPAIIYRHQIYSIIENRTKVDRDIENLRNLKEIRVFKCDNEDMALCSTSD